MNPAKSNLIQPNPTYLHWLILRGMIYDLVTPLKRDVLTRWRGILIYAITTASLIGFLFQVVSDKMPDSYDDYFPFGDIWIVVIFCVAMILWVHRISGLRLRQSFHYLKYPGVPIAVFCALLLHTLCVRWSTRIARQDETFLWDVTLGYGVFLLLLGTTGFILEFRERLKYAKRLPFVGAQRPLTELSADELVSWVQNPKEIENCSEDYFNFVPRGEKILATLSKEERQSVAIIGPYGSGKSSLLKLVGSEAYRQQYLKTPYSAKRLLFCCVSCWGIEKGNSAAQAILQQIVEQLQHSVDCLAISGLPSRYASSLSKISNYSATLLDLAHANNPNDQLKKLSPILKAVDVRLVIVLEDVDRNGSDFDVHQIEGLLIRFKDVAEITFVICAGQDCKLDFVRLVEHVESLPAIERTTAIEIIGKIREKFCSEKDTVVLSKKTLPDDPSDINQQIENVLLAKRGYQPDDKWNRQLAVLLDTPRALKCGLRRFIRAWETLKGEVDIDQLLVASALRERAPRHFGFLQRRWNDFRWLGKQMEETVKPNHVAESLHREWDDLADLGADRLATRILMAALFPEVNKLVGNQINSTLNCFQSVFDEYRGYVYRDRIFNEYITPGPLRDQPMLQLIATANESEEGLHQLALKITTDEVQFDHFDFFRGAILSTDRSLRLLSAVFDQLRKCDGRKAKLNQRLRTLAQKTIVETRGERPEVFAWVKEEVMTCLPKNLTLAANLIEYVLPLPIADREQTETRETILGELEKHFATASVSTLSECIDDKSSDTLKWLIRGGNDTSKWLGPLLLRASREKPAEMIPEILELTGNVIITTFGNGRQEFTYEFNRDPVVAYLGESGIEIVREIRKFKPQFENWQLERGPVRAIQVIKSATTFLESLDRGSDSEAD